MLRRLAFTILLASAFAHADVTNLQCTQTGSSEYKLSYSMTGNTHQVEVLASTHPEPSSAMYSLAKTQEGEVTVQAGKPGERMYFFLKTDTGEQREISIRQLPLRGTPNFRDLVG